MRTMTRLAIRRRAVPFLYRLAVDAELEFLHFWCTPVSGEMADDAVHRGDSAVGVADDVKVAGITGKSAVNGALVGSAVDKARCALAFMA